MERHDQNVGGQTAQRIADACAVEDEQSDLTCTFCAHRLPDAKRLLKHTGHHLEQCALYALPAHLMGLSTDDQDSASSSIMKYTEDQADRKTVVTGDNGKISSKDTTDFCPFSSVYPYDEADVIDPFSDDGKRDRSQSKGRRGKADQKDGGIRESPAPIYEGFVVERLPSNPGEQITWRRCGRRALQITQDELVDLVKKHRRATNVKSADAHYRRLSADQRAIIARILEEKRLYEKSRTAEWTLVDVQPIERRTGAFTRETCKIQIVLKRKDTDSTKRPRHEATKSSKEPLDELKVPLPWEAGSNIDVGEKKTRAPTHTFGHPLADSATVSNSPSPFHPQEVVVGSDFGGFPHPNLFHPQEVVVAPDFEGFPHPNPFYPADPAPTPGIYDDNGSEQAQEGKTKRSVRAERRLSHP